MPYQYRLRIRDGMGAGAGTKYRLCPNCCGVKYKLCMSLKIIGLAVTNVKYI
ncbi:hypothetical protein [Anaerotignum sp.]|uniref:hypothetical protein n=1 Tax=Anaerotignum sp. TaxID=2039241 RepID=UPI00289BF2C7|nr:hypothetical protein [Anaerotignum sp.]